DAGGCLVWVTSRPRNLIPQCEPFHIRLAATILDSLHFRYSTHGGSACLGKYAWLPHSAQRPSSCMQAAPGRSARHEMFCRTQAFRHSPRLLRRRLPSERATFLRYGRQLHWGRLQIHSPFATHWTPHAVASATWLKKSSHDQHLPWPRAKPKSILSSSLQPTLGLRLSSLR